MSKFIKVNGNLAQISVTSSVNVWGVNGAGEIWNYIGPDPTSKNPWQQIAGNFARDLSQGSISAGSLANVWGINSAGQVWKYTGTPPPAKPSSGSNPWQEMAQSLPGGEFSGAYQVAAASDGTVWLIVRSRAGEGLPPVPFGDPVFSISRLLSDGTFKPIKGNLWQISVGSAKSVWGLDPEGNIYSYTQDDNNPWNLILGTSPVFLRPPMVWCAELTAQAKSSNTSVHPPLRSRRQVRIRGNRLPGDTLRKFQSDPRTTLGVSTPKATSIG
jgi:virginiamycin B lyase